MTHQTWVAKPSLLLLTNLYNGSAEEDIYLSSYLRKFFHVTLAHPLDTKGIEDRFDIVLIRNIWPTFEYEAHKTALLRRLIKKGHLAPSAAEAGYLQQSNYQEKEYLLDLFKQGYPVIPSVDRLSDVSKLGETVRYFIKPKNKCDGIGSAKLTKLQLQKRHLKNYVIQPHIKFDYEICFFFVDNRFVSAISTPNRLKDDRYALYKPTREDLEFAHRFVAWNQMSSGLQRVDALRVSKTKELLLTELEDLAPYLFLLEPPKLHGTKILIALAQSIHKRLSLKRKGKRHVSGSSLVHLPNLEQQPQPAV